MTDAFDNPIDVGDEVIYVSGNKYLSIQKAVITRISGTRVYVKTVKLRPKANVPGVEWADLGSESFTTKNRIIGKAVFNA